MKKSLALRMLSMLLVLALCLGMAGCLDMTINPGGGDTPGGETPGGDNPGGDTPGGETPGGENPGGENPGGENPGGGDGKKTDEELFDIWRMACAEAYMHTGGITWQAKLTQSVKNNSRDDVTNNTVRVTYDPATNRFFREQASERRVDLVHTTTEKGFVENGTYYVCAMNTSSAEGTVPDVVYRLPDSTFTEALREACSFSGACGDLTGALWRAGSYADLLDIFEDTHAQLQANEIAYLRELGTLSAEGDLRLSSDLSIAEGEDGSITLTVITTALAPELLGAMQSVSDARCRTERSITCKDGVITDVIVHVSVEQESSQNSTDPTGSGASTTIAMSIDAHFTCAFAFDEEMYGSLPVSLPDDAAEIEVAEEKIDVMIGPMCYDYAITPHAIPDGTPVTELIDHLENRFMAFDEALDGYASVLTVHGLYADKALTQPLDPDITFDELIALGTVYVDYTMADGYALFQELYEEEYELSPDYDIVKTTIISFSRIDGDNVNVYTAGDEINLTAMTKYGAEHRVYVNGNKTDGTTLTIEGGQIYIIRHVTVYRETNLGINHVLGGLFNVRF